MFGLSKLTAAFANLAASVNALAAVVDAAAGRLRQQLALEDHSEPIIPAGGVVLGQALPAPVEDNTDGQSANGRKRGKAAPAA
jgi:hypothetical protein